jgi:hypothetical protein
LETAICCSWLPHPSPWAMEKVHPSPLGVFRVAALKTEPSEHQVETTAIDPAALVMVQVERLCLAVQLQSGVLVSYRRQSRGRLLCLSTDTAPLRQVAHF